jgi:hypothetical protein
MPSTYTLISSNVLGSSAASVTFSAIPGTYTDLVVRWSARSDGATTNEYSKIVLNSDTATNYSETYVRGTGSTADSGRYSSNDKWLFIPIDGANNTASTFSNSEIYIPSYTSSNKKVAGSFSVREENAATANAIVGNAHLWQGTAAITSIALSPNNGTNFVSGSSFYLYGIKNS